VISILYVSFHRVKNFTCTFIQRITSPVEVETRYPYSECFRILARGMSAMQTGVPGDEIEKEGIAGAIPR
jgi:hypothetical protein